MKFFLKAIGLLVACAIIGPITAGLILNGVAKDVPAPGRLVDVGGYKLHINCAGPENDLPPVIIEAGVGMPSPMFHWFQQSLAKDVRVCTYDRAGLGWSQQSGLSRDSHTIATALHELLDKAGISRPFVFAGHSIGGLHLRVYNALYPGDVKAVAFLDTSHPRQNKVMNAGEDDPAEMLGPVSMVFETLVSLGLTRLYSPFTSDIADEYPDEVMSQLNHIFNQTGVVHTLFTEMKASDTVMAQAAATGGLGEMPIIVISAAAPFPEHFLTKGMDKKKLRRDFDALQKEIVGISSNSRQIIMEDAHHMSLVFNQKHAEEASGHILQLVLSLN